MWENITQIEEIGYDDAIDIEVSGNHLFYANNILTHNSNSDVELTETSESFGLPATADFMIALIATEELSALNQYMVKQLKNRYSDLDKFKRFVIGVDKSKMRLYNCEQSAQDDIVDDSPVFDKSKYKEREDNDYGPKPKFKRNAFEGFR